MKQRMQELAIEAAGKGFTTFATSDFDSPEKIERFAELIVRECIFTLRWHGCDDSVPYVEWMAKNKLGVDNLAK